MDKGQPNADNDAEQQRHGLGFLAILRSVLAAALGVQSSKHRERDFQEGSAGVFIAAGILFTVLFIGTVATIVQWVLATR